MPIEVASLSRPCAGETENGDRAFTRREGDRSAIAVIDALGHGPIASECAARAVAALEKASFADAIDRWLALVHEALRGSRGSAMTLVLTDGDRLFAAGIGNVALHSSISFIPTSGILGSRWRTPRVATGAAKGRLVLHSDGVSHRFDARDYDGRKPDEACELILKAFGVAHDDATVLVADL